MSAMRSKIKAVFYLYISVNIFFIFICGCSKKSQQTALKDQPLSAFQNELLELAFETATAIPSYPHIKDRSRSQEDVVLTCLELDQPLRAAGYIAQIQNWRKFMCYANLAQYCAEKGSHEKAQEYLVLAEQVKDVEQEWQLARIKVNIAKTKKLLGMETNAEQLEKRLSQSETLQKEEVEAAMIDDATFEENCKVLDGMIQEGEFELVKGALKAYAQLYNRFYEEGKRRVLIEDKIKNSWKNIPVFLRVELLMEMAEYSLSHSDPSKALEMVSEVQGYIDEHEWRRLEILLPRVAKLIELRHRSGDVEGAQVKARETLDYFTAHKKQIVNIYRAEAIRPLAETYQAMGDTESAIQVYKLAVEEGVENINSRPRAEDLSATCCSLALHAVQPDAELMNRIRQIRSELGDPW